MMLITMFQRIQGFGELIMMVSHMITELRRFIITTSLLICLFVIVGM